MKHRIGFVIQRYGLDVNGGAEYLCRRIAELMNDTWDIDILTTCAKDYQYWTNHYPIGESIVNGVRVIRFPVKRERNLKTFNRLSERIFGKQHSDEDEEAWMTAQGPNSPSLLEYLEQNRHKYDLFIFVTYLYETTYGGLPLVADKSFLIPTAHDEPPIYLSLFKKLFSRPRGFIFSTPEEKEFLKNTFDIDCSWSDIIGVGVDVDSGVDTDTRTDPGKNTRSGNNVPKPYVIYVGRIDGSKGCGELFNYWDFYQRRNGSDLTLVLIGGQFMEIPDREDVRYEGYVGEDDKSMLISNAECLIMPSPYESFSIVLLESWFHGKPVLVNGSCDVLRGQCRRSNGGLWYDNFDEFEACLKFILDNPLISEVMARNGKQYTLHNYDMNVIKNKYIDLIDNYLSFHLR